MVSRSTQAGRNRRVGVPARVLALCGLLLLLLGAGSPAAAQDGPRIGYVDLQRLLERAPQVVDARARLAREFAARDLRLTGDQQRLAQLESEQRAANESGDRDRARQLEVEINALQRSVERTQQRLQEELRSRTEEEIDQAFPRISEAVAEYAREQGYDLVLGSPVVYASGRIDITDAVLDRLQRDFASEPQ